MGCDYRRTSGKCKCMSACIIPNFYLRVFDPVYFCQRRVWSGECVVSPLHYYDTFVNYYLAEVVKSWDSFGGQRIGYYVTSDKIGLSDQWS